MRSDRMGYEMDKKKNHNSKPKNKQSEVKEQKNIIENVEEIVENAVEAVEETVEKAEDKAENVVKAAKPDNILLAILKRAKNTSLESYRTLILAALKVALPAIATVIVIATIISLVQVKNEKQEEEAVAMTEAATGEAVVMQPLEVDAYPAVNEVMNSYYNALATGDMETVKAIRDYISETDLLQLKINNEFIESYHIINCYTRNSIEENSYFVYVVHETKFKDFETLVPGVTTHYVYPVEDGSLKISKVFETADGGLAVDKENAEQVNVALMESSGQDDIFDIFNKVDVEYKEILAANEDLNNFLVEMTEKVKIRMGEEIAKLETSEESSPTEETTSSTAVAVAETEGTEVVVTEQPQTQIVDEEVKATTTVNVRSSDSENADKIGRLEEGKVVKRTETKINGWSKIIYEGKEAYVKSDYLELLSSNPVEETTDNTTSETSNTTSETKKEGTVTANTNVNVRNKPSTSSDTIGKANGGSSYKLLEDQGEWLKIEYKGQTGFVKAEYFD